MCVMKWFWLSFYCLSAVGWAEPATVDELPPITVTGKVPSKRLPVVPTEFPGERLTPDTSRPSRLAEILRPSPVVTTRSRGEGSEPSFIIRGQDPVQTKILLDGISLNDAEFGAVPIQFVPPAAIGSVDVYAEGIPASFGEDGLGGALQWNLIGPGRRPYAGARVGSYEFVNAFAGVETPWVAAARWNLDYRQSRENFPYFSDSGTPFNPTDDVTLTRDGNRFRRFSLLPVVELSPTWRLLHLSAWNDQEIPGPTVTPARARLTTHYHLVGLKGDESLATGFGLSSQSNVRWSSDSLSQRDTLSPILPGETLALGIGTLHTLKRQWAERTSSDLTLGARWERARLLTPSALEPRRESERWQLPLALVSSFPVLSELTISPAFLGMYTRYESDGSSKDTFHLSPRVAVAFRQGPARFRGAVGNYFRNPSLVELYGSPAGLAPSPGLEPERAWKGEVGTDWEWASPAPWLRQLRFSYTYAAARPRNLITFLQNSQLTKRAENIGSSLIQSHEVAMEGSLRPAEVTLRGTLNHLPTKNLSPAPFQNGRELPNRPAWLAGGEAVWSPRPWSLGYYIQWTGSTYWDLGNLKRRDGIAEHSAYVAWFSSSLGELRLEGQNLFDVTVAQSSFGDWLLVDNTTGYAGYPGPGRRFFLTWRSEL